MPLVNSTTYKGKIVKDMNSKEMLISLPALISSATKGGLTIANVLNYLLCRS